MDSSEAEKESKFFLSDRMKITIRDNEMMEEAAKIHFLKMGAFMTV
jgi:hypothetical protein